MALLAPDHYNTSVATVDLGALADRGITALLIDLDNTLLPRDSSKFPPEVLVFAQRVRAAGMRACLVSNNWHARVRAAADELGFVLVPRALKPLPFGFRAGMRLLRARPEQTAVIGDQLFTDILGGNACGLVTVLVLPLSSTDLPHTLLLRKLESRVLAGRTPTA